MTNTGKIMTGVAIAALVIIVGVTLIDVDVDGELEVPTVDMVGGNIELPSIETSGGNMPRVDVNTADVEFGETETTVEVPTDVNVETEEKTVTLPTVNVDLPEENTTAEENDLN